MDDPHKVVKVLASDVSNGQQVELAYTSCRIIGNGSFGVVFQARLLRDGSGQQVDSAEASDAGSSDDIAIKKVLQDKRFKNRL